MKKKYHEIRLDKEGKEDDIVIQCDSIHLGRMNNNFWWLGIYKKDKRTTFHIITEQDGLNAILNENELDVKIDRSLVEVERLK